MPAIRVWSSELGAFGTNCYIIACNATGQSVVIDPGADDPWIAETLKANGLKPELILLTHGHLDHIGGIAGTKRLTGAKVAVQGEDAAMLVDPMFNGSARFGKPMTAPPPDRLLRDGDEVMVGELRFGVIHTPGHTPGGACFYYAGDGGHLFSGDTLFAGSIGRTDLTGGNFDDLITSIKTKLLTLPPDTTVYPGHGPTTSIGDEKEYNPFL